MRIFPALVACAFAAGFAGIAEAQMAKPGADGVLRVCADPNSPPLSMKQGDGFENRIAELLAEDLGLKLEYTWFPQRMGFIRHTLRAVEPNSDRFKCDIVMGVPIGYDLAATTRPYYRSTWAMVTMKGKGLDGVRTPDDLLQLPKDVLDHLRFGLIARSPPTDWLLKNKLFDQATPYLPQSGDPDAYPGEIIEKELAAGHIDVAIVWGPIAGYFAKRAGPNAILVPFPAGGDIRYDFEIAMGVRQGDKEWLGRIDHFIETHQKQIDAVLATYNVPLLGTDGKLMAVVSQAAKP
ncbi:MAG TPA: quinoprotein dehydrogenase-associated putative ABC transporter substrate-binding protein [Burkholderiaceae bacterium]|nr:quinoprotein dehydrogenase-associated putative ABC transporter substrate-binding protein [Burkholderiaceae bacterium]